MADEPTVRLETKPEVEEIQLWEDERGPDRLQWSASYFLVCILLPVFAGALSAFAWSGYTLYVRSMGWSLSMAGVGISIGSLGRLITQQVVFRLGIWTCAVFALLQVASAVLAMIYIEEAAIIFCQAGAIVAFDVTVAIEGITFDTWSDSEALVGQAQASVLSTFTIAYATAATLGGVVYDFGGWSGMSIFHAVCAGGQFLALVVQPALRQSFKEFVWGVPEDDEEEEEEEDEEDELPTLEDQATSIVPAPSRKTVSDKPTLPGAVEDEESAQATDSKLDEAVTPNVEIFTVKTVKQDGEKEDRPSTSLVPNSEAGKPKSVAPRSKASRASVASKMSKVSLKSKASKASKASRASMKSSGSAKSRGSFDGVTLGTRLVSTHLARNTAFTVRSTLSSNVSARTGRSTQKSKKSRETEQSKETGMSRQTGQTKHTGVTMHTSQTVRTVASALSSFSRLSEAAENFQYNFAINNSLRPHVASRAAQNVLDETTGGMEEVFEEPEQEAVEGARTSVQSRRSRKSTRIQRDMYCVAFLMAMCSFNNNGSYGIEWSTFAIFFKEQHGWTSATWAGICQTSGDLLAAVMMSLLKNGERPDLESLTGFRFYWHAVTGQPYNLVLFMFGWAVLMGGLCLPSLPAAIASQVIMGTLYVFATKAVTDMNLFYSLGDPQVFLQLQVQCRNADAVGALVAGYFAFALYELHPLAPYLASCANAILTALIVMVGFCHRVGFGVDIERAEARRSVKKGIKRKSSWKSDLRATEVSSAGDV